MRIAIIRGRNLASLVGDFEVDLESGPLGEASLFAITGPTGAGKSTILDTICLALFDKTPRLGEGGQHIAEIGRADDDESLRIRANDVRSLLSRGAGEGYAEVEFISGDGRRYRARWEVWRARKRANGALQPQAMSLQDVAAGTQLGGTKTETLRAIQERVGLSFDQFRRAVLLAQGDFAAFLEAGRDERAELLERMTGTEIYARLSAAAYRRHAECDRGIAAIEAERARVGLLSEEARAEAEAARDAARAAGAEARAAVERAEATLGWYAELGRRRKGEAEALEALAAAEAAWGEAEPRRAALAEVEAAEPMRGLLEAALQAAQHRDRAAEARERAAALLVEAAARAEGAAAAAEAARGELSRAKEALEAAGPELQAARALDERIEHHREALAGLEGERGAAEARLVEARRELEAMETRRGAAEAQRNGAREWLEGHRAAAELGPGRWAEIEADFEAFEGRRAEAAAQAARAGRLEREAVEAEARRDAGAARLEALKTAAEEAEAACRQAEAAVAAAPQEAVRERAKRLRALEEAAGRCHSAAEAAARAESERAGAEARARAERAVAEAAAKRLGTQAEEATRLEGERAEAARALEKARGAQTYEEARRTLREGEACPLCGATEHPWADGSPLSGLVKDYEERCDELDRRLKEAAQAQAGTAKEQAAAQARAEAEAQRGGEAEARLAGLEARWEELAAALAAAGARWREAGGDVGAEELAEAVEAVGRAPVGQAEAATEALGAALQQVGARLAADERAADQADKAARAARAALDAARQARDGAMKAALEAGEGAQKARRAALEAAAEGTRLQGLAGELARSLERALAGWPSAGARLSEDAGALREAVRGEVAEARVRADGLRAAEAALAELGPAQATAAAGVSAAEGRLGELEVELGEAGERLAALREARTERLGGRGTAEVERELKAALAAEEEAAQEAAAVSARASAGAAGAASTAKAGAAEAETRAEEARTAGERLEDALREAGIERAELERRLEHPARWVLEERAALTELREAWTRAQAVLEERQDQRRRHEQGARPEVPEEEAQARCEAAREQLEAHMEALQRHQLQLAQDDERRALSAELDARAQTARDEARVWATLNQLIGSAKGDLFRRFAQGLTLDALLLHANRQLDDLTSRYRIERVPRSDMDLQVVDREMGDEVRTVKSLSGGETFLVSLALALGLASLSAADTSVESLFIDEGFGTLDRETLDIAIDALDALHATGRKVGIISHVEGLAEHLGAEVRVRKLGGGRSRVEVCVQGLTA
ncbi:MAG: AAA family ATPase [Deltaproteobacteria bacterium]|nr:AAA family ATPase [Deltaproteobacteria bacterium]